MDLGINGKVALVTGGNRGIGLASALEMAKEGCDLVITGRNETDLAEAEEQIKALGARTLVIAADLEKVEGVDKIVSAAFDEFGQIDILFNNAGHLHLSTTLSATDKDWESQLNIHLMACVRTCRAIIPKMVEKGWGRIINMSSLNGIAPRFGAPDYSAAKAAVVSYTRSIAMEFSRYGICANTICPGMIDTDIRASILDKLTVETGKTGQSIHQSVVENLCGAKRIGKPEEVGKVVAFLASECASFVTGCSIQVDGAHWRALSSNCRLLGPSLSVCFVEPGHGVSPGT